MSQTAKELADQGKYDEAIAADPNYGRAYYLKGLKQSTNEAAAALYEKAISLGFEEELVYHKLGNCYANMEKKPDAVVVYDKYLLRKPDCWETLKYRGFMMISLNKMEEAIKNLTKATEINAKGANVNGILGLLLEEQGREDDAIKQYDIGISLASTDFKSNYYKGRLLAKHDKFKEAIPLLEQALKANRNHGGVCLWLGKSYTAVGDAEKAKTYFELGITHQAKLSVDFCNRGQIYKILGNKEKALEDIKKTKEMLDTGRNDGNLSASTIKFMTDSIRLILETEEAAAKSESAIQKLDQNNTAVMKFMAGLKKLQEEKEVAQDKVMGQLTGKQNEQTTKDIAELERIKAEFNQQLAQMKQEMAQLSGKVEKIDKKVTALENDMEAMKEDLANKMDDFDKKLDSELKKADLSPEEIESLKGYFSAFIGTFSATFVTAQVINSGQVKLDAGSSAGSVLSVLASFAPFIGDTLSTAVSTIDEFLQTKEMKTNARKILNLAHDSTKLSQVVGKSGFDIVLNKKKQQQILKTTDEDLEEISGNLYQKVAKFCQNLSQKVDAYLYSELYSSAAQRVGHNDANQLIGLWLKDSVAPFGIEKRFVKEVIDQLDQPKQKEGAVEKTPEGNRSACCNMF